MMNNYRPKKKMYAPAYVDGFEEMRVMALNKASNCMNPHKQDAFYDIAKMASERMVQMRRANKAALTRIENDRSFNNSRVINLD